MQQSAPASSHFPVTAVVPPGLEEPAAAELVRLGASEVRPLRRAVACVTDLAGLYRLHLRARLPFRFLRELARFPCHDRFSLERGVQGALVWQRWLPPESSFKVEVSGSLPQLNHSHYTALQVKNAVIDVQRELWGARSSVDLDDPDLSLHLHLSAGDRPGGRGPDSRGVSSGSGRSHEGTQGSVAILSLDGGGGASLHRRGYRAAMGLAPLKENLAAGLIALTGWDGTVPLLDPLCGSGTLLIEAASMALNRAPGLLSAPPAGGVGADSTAQEAGPPRQPRHFGFERWPDFDPDLWRQAWEAARVQERRSLADGTPLAPLIGLERDPAVLAQARANVAAAGLEPWIRLEQGDARDLTPPEQPGLLVCNPPYGARLGQDEDLEQLYADLGAMLKQRCSGWTLWLLSGNPELTGALRMKASRRIAVSNGGIDCRWLRYDIR